MNPTSTSMLIARSVPSSGSLQVESVERVISLPACGCCGTQRRRAHISMPKIPFVCGLRVVEACGWFHQAASVHCGLRLQRGRRCSGWLCACTRDHSFVLTNRGLVISHRIPGSQSPGVLIVVNGSNWIEKTIGENDKNPSIKISQ